jgi:chromosome segregation ATPase
MSDQWETFCDVGYYHMWRLRRKTERGWNDGFHINTKAESEGLCELLNKLEGEIERERALANEAIATWKKTREERDAALIGYNECRATIEDARRALGATAHEGLLLAAMRVTEQRDRLLEEREQWRMSSVCRELSEQLDRLAEQKESNHKVPIAIGRMFYEAREQRDRLAGELKEAQDAIEMMLRDSSCRRIPAYTKKQLAAVKGLSDE